MNVNKVILAAKQVIRAEEDDPVPCHGPLLSAIQALRDALTQRPMLAVLEAVKADRKAIARPKLQWARHDPYKALVASRPCCFCGIVGYSQAAHENYGKGLGMKVDDRRTFPLCHVGASDCHGRFDRYELFSNREQHRKWGRVQAEATARAIHEEGQWPDNLEYPY